LLGLTAVERACHQAEDALARGNAPARVDDLLALKDWFAKTFAAWSGKLPRPEPAAPKLAPLEDGASSRASAAPAPPEAAGATIPEGDPELLAEIHQRGPRTPRIGQRACVDAGDRAAKTTKR